MGPDRSDGERWDEPAGWSPVSAANLVILPTRRPAANHVPINSLSGAGSVQTLRNLNWPQEGARDSDYIVRRDNRFQRSQAVTACRNIVETAGMIESRIVESPAMTFVGLEASFNHGLSQDSTAAQVIGPLWGQ